MDKEDYLFNDMFDTNVEFTDDIKDNMLNQQIRGDVRLANGMYRTDAEQEQYIAESLEMQLP